MGDQIGIIAVVDQNAATHLKVQIEHSTDGVNFANKRASPEFDGPITAGAVANTVYAGESWPNPPSLKYVRIRVELIGILAPSGRVQVFAVVRDRRGMPGGCGCDVGAGEGVDDDSGDVRPRIYHGSTAQIVAERKTEVAWLKADHPVEAIAALGEALRRAPRHLVGAGKLQAALTSLPEARRAELADFGAALAQADPRAAEEAMREILGARGTP